MAISMRKADDIHCYQFFPDSSENLRKLGEKKRES